MVAQHWRRIGIFAEVREMERVLAFTRTQQQRAPHPRLDQRRHRAALSVPAPRHPGRSDRGVHGAGIRQVVRVGRRAWGASRPIPNLKKILELFRGAAGQKDDERNKTAQEIWKILVDQQYSIGTVGQSPALMGVRLVEPQARQHPVARLHRPALPHAGQLAAGDVLLSIVVRLPTAGTTRRRANRSGGQSRMLAFIVRRLLLAILTIWVISVLSFAIIQLPPGDFVDRLHRAALGQRQPRSRRRRRRRCASSTGSASRSTCSTANGWRACSSAISACRWNGTGRSPR